MEKIKLYICIQSIMKYRNMINIIKAKYPNVSVVTSIDLVEEEMKANYEADIFVVFLEDIFFDEISNELKYQFNFDNNICIAISEDTIHTFNRAHYIYDVLQYNNHVVVRHFLKRLEKDLYYRAQLFSATSEIRGFYNVGQRLVLEKDINALMETILDSSMKMTSADAGSLYIVVDHEGNSQDEWSFYDRNKENKYLKFIIAKNNSIKLKLQSTTIPILNDNVVGYTVLNDKPVRINDAYNISPQSPYKFNSKIDDVTGYQTKSILTVPMKDHQNRILGVIQLINKKKNGVVIPFTFKDEMTIYALAGQASITLENNALYKDMEKLLEKYRQIIHDEIDKQKQIDEELNKLLSAVEHSPSTVIITDLDGSIQYVNPKFTEITGYEYKEVIGKNPRILKTDHYNNDFYRQFWETIKSGKEWRGEFRNKKKNGEVYWASMSISSLKDSQGKIKYFIAVREDITEKKLINEQLKSKNIELERALEQLRKTQAQLIQKEKMVGIGQLASGIAHEVNNPLGFILSNTRTLEKYMTKFRELLLMYQEFIKNNSSAITSEQFRHFEQIKIYEEDNNLDFLVDDIIELLNSTNIGLERVKEIVDALRLFSNIDQLNEYEEYDLNQGVLNCVLMLKYEMDNSINIHKDLNEIPSFKAIGGEMNQVVLSLLSNAVYAVKQKDSNDQEQIIIKTWHDRKNVFLQVQDSGIGIAKDHLNDIFNPFFTTKPEGEGIGLGLTIVHEVIVERQKGEILVNSDEGAGTKVTLIIPKNR